MGLPLLAFVAARGLMQVFNLSAPHDLRLPLARHLPEACAVHLPEACAVLFGVLASHAAWVQEALERGRAAVAWRRPSRNRDVLDDYILRALLSISD